MTTSTSAHDFVKHAGKLTGMQIRLPDGHTVTVERSNGYVLSGHSFDHPIRWWAIDLRNDDAEVIDQQIEGDQS